MKCRQKDMIPDFPLKMSENIYETMSEKPMPKPKTFSGMIAWEDLKWAMRYGLNVEPDPTAQVVKECGVIGRPQKWDY